MSIVSPYTIAIEKSAKGDVAIAVVVVIVVVNAIG
jgi:hypothetical protein